MTDYLERAVMTASPVGNAQPAEAPTTWRPQDLGPYLNGDLEIEEPSALRRTDGEGLLYAGRINAIIGETESAKTWLALEACRQELDAGRRCVFLDFEDTAPRIVGRLLVLGVEPVAIARHFAYVAPEERLSQRGWQDLATALEGAGLVIIDGITEAMSREGLELRDNTEVQKFYDLLPRPLARTGGAVVTLDHVAKDRETRGRFALGGQHKMAAVDGAAYVLETVLPFGRGKDGLVRLKVAKDRPGAVRGLPGGGNAEIRVRAGSDLVTLDIEPTTRDEPERTFRPTHLMERVSRSLEGGTALSKNAIEGGVTGKRDAVRLALELLVAEGYIAVEKGPRGALLHRSERPFRESDEGADKA